MCQVLVTVFQPGFPRSMCAHTLVKDHWLRPQLHSGGQIKVPWSHTMDGWAEPFGLHSLDIIRISQKKKYQLLRQTLAVMPVYKGSDDSSNKSTLQNVMQIFKKNR